LMMKGFEVLHEFEQGILNFMNEQGYKQVEDFRGIALDQISDSMPDIRVFDVVARVNPDLCDGCKLCTKPSHCGLERRAMIFTKGKAKVDEEQCFGCAMCYYICPLAAIEMVRRS